jgi:hypothetical protein
MRIADKWIRNVNIPVLGLHSADDLVSHLRIRSHIRNGLSFGINHFTNLN